MSIYHRIYELYLAIDNSKLMDALGLRVINEHITCEEFSDLIQPFHDGYNIPWNKGIEHTEETKRRISKVRKSQGMTDKMVEARKKAGEKARGRKHTKAARQKMSDSARKTYENGRKANVTFLSKQHREESKVKMKQIQSNRDWKPSLGKTWKRSPESVAKAVETRRLNKLKKLALTPSL